MGSINLAHFVKTGKDGSFPELDREALKETVRTAVRFLDDVLDVNNYPIEIIAEMSRGSRKIGLGIMGFADMLNLMGISYASIEGRNMAENVMGLVHDVAWGMSEELAKEKGVFPLFDQSDFDRPVRNATVTTNAPTGTISMIAGCSSGVEPIFAYVYQRNIMDQSMLEVNPILREVLTERGFSEDIFRKILEKGSIGKVEEIPEDIRNAFISAPEVSPKDHVLMQAAFQKHTDNAVSKTVNLPNSATEDDVREVYMLAYQTGCKGVTVYRDGSRDSQVLTTGATKKEETPMQAYGEIRPRERSKVTQGFTEKVKIGCGSLFVTVNHDDEGICEVFTSTGKRGGCPSQSEATARLASVAIRSGVSIDEVYDQLKGIRCPSTISKDGMECTSCPDAIARILMKVKETIDEKDDAAAETFKLKDGIKVPDIAGTSECPVCHKKTLIAESGCVKCLSCAYSKCD